jgi:hypothetical protein
LYNAICVISPESSKVIIRMTDITNYESDFNFLDKMTMNHDEILSSVKNIINEE